MYEPEGLGNAVPRRRSRYRLLESVPSVSPCVTYLITIGRICGRVELSPQPFQFLLCYDLFGLDTRAVGFYMALIPCIQWQYLS